MVPPKKLQPRVDFIDILLDSSILDRMTHPRAGLMIVNFVYEASANNAPAYFFSDLNTAAQILDSTLPAPITVNIEVGYGEISENGSDVPLPNGFSEGGPAWGQYLSYSNVRSLLVSDATTPAAIAAADSLPIENPTSQSGLLLSNTQEKVFGMLPSNDAAIDGYVGFGTGWNSYVGVALHEITHAMGRDGNSTNTSDTILNLYKFSSPGVLDFTTAAGYFSIDGGNTNLQNFDSTRVDPWDWSAGIPDPLSLNGANYNTLSNVDITVLNALGLFDLPPPAPTLSVVSDTAAIRGQTLSLSSLVTVSDPGQIGYQKLELWDSNGTVAGGQFIVNGVTQSGGHEIDVTPTEVANTVFDVGTGSSSDTLWARLLQNNGTLTGWQQFSIALQLPTLTVHNVASATRLQTVSLSTLETISDPNGFGYQKLELWDSNGTVAGGQFVVNEVAQTGGHEID